MIVQDTIEERLQTELTPSELVVENESHQHSVPPNSETHFKVVIVSEQFQGQRQVARHRAVYQHLNDLLAGPVHALALHTYTPSEWRQREAAPDSPDCLGGSKAG